MLSTFRRLSNRQRWAVESGALAGTLAADSPLPMALLIGSRLGICRFLSGIQDALSSAVFLSFRSDIS
jgi:hypothetical protein